MRSESANRFADAPVGVPFRECPFGDQPPPPAIVDVQEGRRIAEAHWVPGAGGAVVISDEDDRYAHQELFFVSTSGSHERLPLRGFLRSPVSDVYLLPHLQPLLVVEELWWTRAENTRWFMEEAFGFPDHGDLVVMDLRGIPVARHRSAYGPQLSPSFQWMSYWRSGNNGLHNLFVTPPAEESARFVAAIVEVDPGSGKSFSECWSGDSRYLHLSGGAYGLRSVCWTYDVMTQELYSQEPYASGYCAPSAM